MSEDKTIKISDFTNQETDYLSELITEKLNEQGITAQSFAFDIEVDYIEENDKAQLPRVYYHSWITGPQGARFEIFKSNHSTEVINKTKSRLRYDQDVVKIYVVDGEPEDYDHKKERLEFYDIEENNNG